STSSPISLAAPTLRANRETNRRPNRSPGSWRTGGVRAAQTWCRMKCRATTSSRRRWYEHGFADRATRAGSKVTLYPKRHGGGDLLHRRATPPQQGRGGLVRPHVLGQDGGDRIAAPHQRTADRRDGASAPGTMGDAGG